MDEDDETIIIDEERSVPQQVIFQLTAELPPTCATSLDIRSCGWFRMWGGKLFLVILTFLILAIVLPVSLQEHGTNYQDMLHEYPNPGDRNSVHGVGDHNGGGQHSHHNGGGHSHHNGAVGHEGEDVTAPPPPQPPPIATDEEGGGGDVTEGDTPKNAENEEREDDTGDIASGEEPKFHMKVFGGGGQAAATAATESEASSGNAEPSGNQCQNVQDKLESLMSLVSSLQKSLEKMENLIQSSAVDEQLSKCIQSISASNQSLALKHWNTLLKYETNEKPKLSFLTQLIKEAYNGNENNILEVAEFIQETKECEGFSVLYHEMKNYGHVFGHSFIFSVGLKVTKICGGASSPIFESLPSSVKSTLKGSFTLQNKFNKGFLYYAKRCVARHYYHCLDILTKVISQQEFSALEVGGDEWARYHWKINATGNQDWMLLNQDKFWSYRLQDLNNSPRFRMEEAGSVFEVDMASFRLFLQTENEIKIQIRDTKTYLEGEEFNGSKDLLLHSFHKDEKAAETDKIYWIVKDANQS